MTEYSEDGLDQKQSELVRKLISDALAYLSEPREIYDFGTNIPEAEPLLNDIEAHPHIFILGCVMDRQIRAGKAWAIPYQVGVEAGGFTFEHFHKLKRSAVELIFNAKKLHRFNTNAADCFFSAIQDIHTKYGGDGSRIWTNKPKAAAIIRRFFEFKGVGPKIATMATNILVRDFKVPMEQYSAIDISPDVQVMKFFIHHGLLRDGASNDELMYRARELYPDYPGVFDHLAWSLGRDL